MSEADSFDKRLLTNAPNEQEFDIQARKFLSSETFKHFIKPILCREGHYPGDFFSVEGKADSAAFVMDKYAGIDYIYRPANSDCLYPMGSRVRFMKRTSESRDTFGVRITEYTTMCRAREGLSLCKDFSIQAYVDVRIKNLLTLYLNGNPDDKAYVRTRIREMTPESCVFNYGVYKTDDMMDAIKKGLCKIHTWPDKGDQSWEIKFTDMFKYYPENTDLWYNFPLKEITAKEKEEMEFENKRNAQLKQENNGELEGLYS